MATMRFGQIASDPPTTTVKFRSYRLFEVLDEELREYKDYGNRHESANAAQRKAKDTFPEIAAWWVNRNVGAHGCLQTQFYCIETRTTRVLRIMGVR